MVVFPLSCMPRSTFIFLFIVIEIGFGLWIDAVTNHRYLAKINKLDCITGKASILDQFVGTYRMYKIIQNYEFEMKIKRKYDVYGGDKQAQFYKCNIRDRHGNIISTQLHIVRTTGMYRNVGQIMIIW